LDRVSGREELVTRGAVQVLNVGDHLAVHGIRSACDRRCVRLIACAVRHAADVGQAADIVDDHSPLPLRRRAAQLVCQRPAHRERGDGVADASWRKPDRERAGVGHRGPPQTGVFDAILESEGAKVIKLPARAPNLNAFAERWAQSVQHEALDHFIVVNEIQLNHIVSEYLAYYHEERPHQGKDNLPLAGDWSAPPTEGAIRYRMRLGGL